MGDTARREPSRRISERLAQKQEKSAVQETFARPHSRGVRRKPLRNIGTNNQDSEKEAEFPKKRRFSFHAAREDDTAEAESGSSRVLELTEELSELRSKYEKLKELKFADVETIYKKYKDSVKERNTASDELLGWYKSEADRLRTMTQKSKEVNACKELETFRRDNAALKSEVLDLKARLVESELKCLDVDDKLDGEKENGADEKIRSRRISAPKSIVEDDIRRLYEVLTGGVVKPTGDNTFDIMVINPDKDRHMRFQIKLSESDVEYEPVEIAVGNGVNVPLYMRESICFEISEAPMFLSKVNAAVFSR
mmetsp:Transcript_11851/g.36117  ORF Transcript_11851/g.36117 Transcript_11851/m.36117 type:complete len:310 (+) Transcript_11851:83-1012(+)